MAISVILFMTMCVFNKTWKELGQEEFGSGGDVRSEVDQKEEKSRREENMGLKTWRESENLFLAVLFSY